MKKNNIVLSSKAHKAWREALDNPVDCIQFRINEPTEGMKFDQDKLRWDLLPIKEVEQIVEILTIGAKKYADWNWQKVENGKDRYFGALMRHLVAWRKGEKFDSETNKNPLSHVACCVLFLMWFENNTKNEE